MGRSVYCEKLKQDLPGLEAVPFKGPLGERVFQHVSQDAWKGWLAHQTMLINEYRLSLMDPASRQFLYQELEKYFFGTGSEKPKGFIEENI